MTEKEARALLSDCDGLGGLERWIVEQPWQVMPGGLRVTASDRSGAMRAVWFMRC